MRILSRKEFLTMPPGTVYAEGKPHVYGPWKIKTGNCSSNDWFFDVLAIKELQDARAAVAAFEVEK